MDFNLARRHMVDTQVRPNDVTSLAIQNAFLETPKEAFLPADFRSQSYVELELNYANGRSIPTARDLAKLIAAAAPRKDELVLLPASGCGYVTAILAQLAGMVVAIEDNAHLAVASQAAFESLDLANIAVIDAKPAEGAPGQGPYDLILIPGAVEVIPDQLVAQLKSGGRLAAIFRAGHVSRGAVVSVRDGVSSHTWLFDATARCIIPGFERARSFKF